MDLNLAYTYIVFLLCIVTSQQSGLQDNETCDDRSCSNNDKRDCAGSSFRCDTEKPFYRRGGSAQAYKPNAPLKSDICHSPQSHHKTATWPFWRSSKHDVPKITVHLQLYDCSASIIDGDKKPDECCCSLQDKGNIKIEVWQTQPNGQYSSLTPGYEEGVCRATLDGTSFTTFAPGSTGILGGLGPRNWDFAPYGPPVIHILFSQDEENYEPLLLHIPIILDRELNPRKFFGPDLRGPAFVTSKEKETSYSIEEWVVDNNKEIEAVINIFLVQNRNNKERRGLTSSLCSSSLYGFPSSFFLEPIAVCVPSMLDFLPL